MESKIDQIMANGGPSRIDANYPDYKIDLAFLDGIARYLCHDAEITFLNCNAGSGTNGVEFKKRISQYITTKNPKIDSLVINLYDQYVEYADNSSLGDPGVHKLGK